MSKLDVIRAWKDEEYRANLSEEERGLLPEHPAGLIELADADLDAASGGKRSLTVPIRRCQLPILSKKNC